MLLYYIMSAFRIPFEDEDMDETSPPPPSAPSSSTPPHSASTPPPPSAPTRSRKRLTSTKSRKNRTVKLTDGKKYKGQLSNGVPHGEGRMKWANGEVYVGHWKKGKRSGHGKMRYEDPNFIYIGEWLDDAIHRGTMKYPDGSKYVGYFKNDAMYGLGTMTWSNGTIYTGEWRDNQRNGPGTLRVFEDGVFTKEYIGNWENDKKNGSGTMKWSDGDSYTGEWRDNNRHGLGKMIEHITVYDGNWENDDKKGSGLFTYPVTSMSYDSTWDNNIMIQAAVNKKGDAVNGHIGWLGGNSNILITRDREEAYPRYNATLHYQNGDEYVGPVLLYKDGRLLRYGQGSLNGKPGTWDEVPTPPVMIEDGDDNMDGGRRRRKQKRKM
jgi:hypothetical protein